ncbi:MAG: PIN domain-containing protein [Myxococcota bacterium]
MGFLIDSSVFIATERKELDLADVLARVGDEPVAIAAITASELLHGVHRARGTKRKAVRSAFVEGVLSRLTVFEFDLRVARAHAHLWASRAAKGKPIGAHDLLIAATALAHELVVATHDARSFPTVSEIRSVVW